MSHQEAGGIVGRGNREGADLFRRWFSELDHTAKQGGLSAYVFVMGSMCEILRTFNLPVVFPEINSLQTAVRRVAHEYLNEAEEYGSDSETRACGPDQCLQYVHQVGRNLGTDVSDSNFHIRRSRNSRGGHTNVGR